jgi:hypothetical protein
MRAWCRSGLHQQRWRRECKHHTCLLLPALPPFTQHSTQGITMRPCLCFALLPGALAQSVTMATADNPSCFSAWRQQFDAKWRAGAPSNSGAGQAAGS